MKRRDEIMVGVLLIAAVVLGIGGTLWVARGGLSKTYTMYTRFPWGAGLKDGGPVLLAGVNVGFVDRVDLDPNGTLVVRLAIRKHYNIPVGTTATVEANGIFGDQLIALTPIRASTSYLPANDTIPVGMSKAGLNALLGKGDSIATDVRGLTLKLRSEFVEKDGIAELHDLVKQLSKVVAQMGTVVTEQSKQLTTTQEQVRKTLASIDSSKVDSTIVNLQATSANLNKLVLSFDSTRTSVNSLIDKVNNGNGTIGKLLNDKSVYARMDSLLARFDSLAADIKKNPKKYINLKVF